MRTRTNIPFSTLFALSVFLSCQVYAERHSNESVDTELCRAAKACSRRLSLGMKTCKIFPVPDESFVRPLPPGQFRLSPLRKGVWLYDDGYMSLILKMGNRLAILDIPESSASGPPGSKRNMVTDATERVLNGTVPKRIDIVYSHGHYDHIGGTSKFIEYMTERYPSARILVWGTVEDRELIENSVTKRAVVPDIIVGKRGRTLSLGNGLDVKILIVGGHTSTDRALYIPRHRKEPSILMHVDVVFPGWAPPFNLAVTEDFGQYIRVHEDLLKFEFDVFVPGHWLIGDRKSVKTNYEYSKDLLTAAVNTIAQLSSEDYVEAGLDIYFTPGAREYGNVMYAFAGVIRELQVETCYKMLIDKWGCRLPGLDLIARTHCFTALTYVNTEY